MSGLAMVSPAGFTKRRVMRSDSPMARYLSRSCSPIASRGDSVEVQQQFHTEPYADFDETNDYSFRLFPTSYADTDSVTLYHDGKLVWGTPPL